MADATTIVSGGPPAAGAAAAARPSGAGRAPDGRQERALAELAHEFEALMMLQMLRQMRQSMLFGEEGDGLGAGTMTDTIDLSLGQALSRSGGFGLAEWLQQALESRYAPPPVGAPAGSAMARSPSPAAAATRSGFSVSGAPVLTAAAVPDASTAEASVNPPGVGRAGSTALPLPLDAPLTSAYGWRRDPLGAGTRFHSGIDLAAAYGREVPAAAGGRVVFAGEQGGYGHTVVVDHGRGITTRYAHLSSIDVEAGARIEAGSVLGRVGSSGRSTGPHLHFEVAENNQPVDPVAAALRFGELLKIAARNADLPHSRSLASPEPGADDAY